MKIIKTLTILVGLLLCSNLMAQSNYDKIQTLLSKAEKAKDSAQFEHAFDLLNEAKKMYVRKSLDSTLIRINNSYANLHTAMGATDSCLFYCNTIIKKCPNNLRKTRAYCETLKIIGGAYVDNKLIDKGITYLEQSLKLSKELYPKGHSQLGVQYLETGINFHIIRQLEKAKEYFNSSYDILKSDSQNQDKIRILYYYMGYNYYRQREIVLGHKYADLGLKLATKLHGKDSKEVAMIYELLTNLHQSQNQFEKANENALKAEQIYKALGLTNHEDMTMIYFNLAQSYEQLGQFENAILYHKKTLDIYKNLKNSNEKYAITRCYYALGLCYINLRQLKKGYENLNKAKVFIKKENLIYIYQSPAEIYIAAIDKALTRCYDAFKDKDKVIAILEKVRQVYIKFGYDEALLGCNLEITNIYYSNKDYQKMEPVLFDTLELAKKLNNQPFVVISNIFLAHSYTHQNNFKKAQHHLKIAAQLLNYRTGELSLKFKEGINHDALNFLLKNRNTYYQKKYEQTKELNLLDSIYLNNDNYIALQEYANSFKNSAIDKKRTLDVNLSFYENCIGNYIEHEQHKSLIKAYEITEKTKSRQLKINFNAANAIKFGNVPNNLFQQETSLKKRISELEKLIFETANDSLVMNYENSLFKLKRQQNQLYQLFLRSYPRYHNLKFNNKIVDITSIQNSLQDDETVIEYFLGDFKTFIFTITKNKFNVKAINITPELNHWISTLRNSIYAYDDEKQAKNYLESAYQLYNVLIKPIKKELKNKLIIIPDGTINYIPFETLLEEKVDQISSYKELPYLIKKHQISYNYSATLYHQLSTQKSELAKENLVAFAPSFKDNKEKFNSITERRNGFENLLYNIPEAEMAHEYISGSLFKGNEATENNFLKMLKITK